MNTAQQINSPEFRMRFSLNDAVERLHTIGHYDFAPSPHANTWEFLNVQEQQGILDTLDKTANLLDDIGLSPDRKYTVAEVERLQAAVAWALGGGQ